MSAYHEPTEAAWVVYDLSDPGTRERAGREIRAWGRERVVFNPLDSETLLVEYRVEDRGQGLKEDLA